MNPPVEPIGKKQLVRALKIIGPVLGRPDYADQQHIRRWFYNDRPSSYRTLTWYLAPELRRVASALYEAGIPHVVRPIPGAPEEYPLLPAYLRLYVKREVFQQRFTYRDSFTSVSSCENYAFVSKRLYERLKIP